MTIPDVSGPAWMTESFGRIGPRPLRSITMPATHDAGMSTLGASTLGSDACNTVTQSGDVLAQLNRGSRYFDLRPVTWDGLDGFGTGHFSKLPLGEYAGGAGQPMADALGQVARFLAQPGSGKEVVVLKFSHPLRLGRKPSGLLPTVPGGGFDPATASRLVAAVVAAVGPSLFTSPTPDLSLNDATLAELAAGPNRIVATFDVNGGFPATLVDPSRGIFSYSDLGRGEANLVVSDSYADSDRLDAMAADQKKKFVAYHPGLGSSFLLSWTLTKTDPVAGPCIRDLAGRANAALLASLQGWAGDGTITPSKVPNMLYVDDIRDASPALQGASYLNALSA